MKEYLNSHGHTCAVLNIGSSRAISSDQYETVLGGFDYLTKLWRFSRQGYVAHVHVNGASRKGFLLAIVAEIVNLAAGRRPFLTFHAGVQQVYFPRPKYPLLLPVFWLMFALARHIICNSEEVKAKIVEYGVSPSKVRPIPAFSSQYLESTDQPLPSTLDSFYRRFTHVVFCYLKMRPLFYPELTVEGFARLADRRQDAGLVLCGTEGYMQPGIWSAVQERIGRADLRDRVIVVEDLPHELFLLALARSSLFLRTHLSDGVCSSVLESLTLGVPVVATENGTRPPGVITYTPQDPNVLASLLDEVLERRDDIARTIPRQVLYGYSRRGGGTADDVREMTNRHGFPLSGSCE